jgi:hypothetical protein
VSIPGNNTPTVVATDSFTGATNNYQGSCFVGTTVDKVYAIKPDVSGPVTVSVVSFSAELHPAVYIHSPVCTTGPELVCSAAPTVTFNGIAGVTYFAIVEGLGAGAGPGTFTVQAESDPPGPGTECSGTPTVLALGDGVGFVGDTTTAFTDSSVPTGAGQCDSATVGNVAVGKDQTFRVTTADDGILSVQVDPDPASGLYPIVYVETVCHDETTSVGCGVAAAVGGSVPLDVTAVAGTTYSIVVDSLGGAVGPYSISASLNLCLGSSVDGY